MDFYRIVKKTTKTGIELSPEFIVRKSKDLMVRGGDFYAIWDEDTGLWCTDEYRVMEIIDKDLDDHYKELEAKVQTGVSVNHIRHFSNGVSSAWDRYVRQIGANYHPLDNRITFANTEIKKEDYVSKRLSYALEAGDYSAWDEIVGTLYSPEERAKIEWAIGAIVSGDSKDIQKFLVLYGSSGTGKSTILKIIERLFEGYTKPFEGKALTSNTNAFATEAFRDNPLVAIQHDGDLSRIEDNSKLNSIVSHEIITVNEKYKSAYSIRPQAFLFMGTNTPVKISDSKSGVLRRLIDVQPTGNLFPYDHYQVLMGRVEFQLGAIAYHCLKTYKKMGRKFYDHYRPTNMMFSTNVYFNFVEAYFDELNGDEGITLKRAYNLYKEFCTDSNNKPMQMQVFREEMKEYYATFIDRGKIGDEWAYSIFRDFKKEKLSRPIFEEVQEGEFSLELEEGPSLVDEALKDQPAQYANVAGNPIKKWANVTTTLSDLDTSKLHFVKVPENHIVIDFDLKDETGEKSLDLNLQAASDWPPTYAELSKGGQGIHLHYIYHGDIHELASEYSDGIEIKTLPGDASLRRRLSRCNNTPIATLTSGLPMKEKRVLDVKTMQSEKGIRELIARNLRKDIHPATKPSIDFIKKILDDAYDSGVAYDVTDLRSRILAFANNSSHRPLECLKVVQTMQFKSEEPSEPVETAKDDRIVFFDVEVYPNLFVVCWKYQGDERVVRMINPKPEEIEPLFSLRLVGFNNRRYDNHMLYARYLGYDNAQLFNLSQKIITDGANNRGLFGEAYGLSYADIYDFSSKKQGLKKFQIELGLIHKEIDIPWEQPVPEDKWNQVVEYCVNDVITTEKTFEDREQDFVARQILADLSGLTVNDTTQRHTARIIFGDDRNPQRQFVYTDLSTIFPGYTFDMGKSRYRDEDPSEGGYVYAEPGMYNNVAVLDVASMHPTSIELLNLFGPFTKNYSGLKKARLAIKHGDYDLAGKMLDGKLKPYLKDPEDAKALSFALKIVINIVYGLTSAKFENVFRDNRNRDNIVAKRGALFMIDLKHAVQEQGFTVAHIKTDSIKIPDATPEIIDFVYRFGEKYGYSFEHETTYDKFCLVNDAVYIAREGDHWEAVGAQFQHPYVYKTLFSKEPVNVQEMCEVKSVQKGAMYIDFDDATDPADMHFIGRTGCFIPVTPESNGGKLYRVMDGKSYAVAGSKGYLWVEQGIVKDSETKTNVDVDMTYYTNLVEDAIKAIEQYGSFEEFVS